jgi:hypothetical protein
VHGRGSPSVDREELHKLTPLQMLAMSKCVDWCNATTGQVRVAGFAEGGGGYAAAEATEKATAEAAESGDLDLPPSPLLLSFYLSPGASVFDS